MVIEQDMILTVLFFSTLGVVQSSGVGHAEPLRLAPVVTAASSQYFERTYNRLIAAPPPVLQPKVPVAHLVPVVPVAESPPLFAPHGPDNVPIAGNPNNPSAPLPPNIAIAVATANAAAPVATILLPPYPFGLPPGYGFISPEQQTIPSEAKTKESTTQQTTTRQTEPTTTEKEQETTQTSSNSDDNFVQALPSNDNINFKQYGLPLPRYPVQVPDQQQYPKLNQPQLQTKQPWPQTQPQPQQQWVQRQQPRPQFWSQTERIKPQWQHKQTYFHKHMQKKPQKLKTSVEVIPVPLAYITPPPIDYHIPQRPIKIVKHIYGFVPEQSAKIIIRPLMSPHRIRSISDSTRLTVYKPTLSAKSNRLQTFQTINRDTEPTTFSPFSRPTTKPPRI